MQRFVFIFLLAVAFVGCSNMEPRRDNAQDQEEALAVWRSPDSNLTQRGCAAGFLIPRGAQIEEIEKVLGSQWQSGHLVIPRLLVTNGLRKPAPAVDYYTVDYEFAEGKVSLVFGPDSKREGFWIATEQWRVKKPSDKAP